MEQTYVVYMMPMPLGSLSADSLNHSEFTSLITTIRFWVAENARTLRRFLSSLQAGIQVSELEIFELHRDYRQQDLEKFMQSCISKSHVGVASEAGIPGMADPGAEVTSWAHRNEVKVVPVSGPSSLTLALSASGLNGQQFTFHGYAPVKEPELRAFLEQMNQRIRKTGYTEILIEAPYRSDRMMAALVRYLSPDLRICMASSLHEPNALIRTRRCAEWKTDMPEIGKNPCIFLIGR